jgi:hypothetical protein
MDMDLNLDLMVLLLELKLRLVLCDCMMLVSVICITYCLFETYSDLRSPKEMVVLFFLIGFYPQSGFAYRFLMRHPCKKTLLSPVI